MNVSDDMRQFPIIWLTGNTGAGKSTLAFAFQHYCNVGIPPKHGIARRVVVLDGDDMRATISTEEDLSAEGRRRHNLRVARLAKLLQQQGFWVIVSVIAPFAQTRNDIEVICQPWWIYIKRSGLGSVDKPYEPPTSPRFVIDNDNLSIEAAQQAFQSFLQQEKVL